MRYLDLPPIQKKTSALKSSLFACKFESFTGGILLTITIDSVWHARLLYKLKNIGITDMMFQYFKNFLSERCICTRVGKTYSSNKTIDMGIPQGSVIAPILFNISIIK